MWKIADRHYFAFTTPVLLQQGPKAAKAKTKTSKNDIVDTILEEFRSLTSIQQRTNETSV